MTADGEPDEVLVDGRLGEGGGQVLRTALALSIATGRPLRLEHIRAKRPKPGLRPQHLACVRAAKAVAGAHVEGDQAGSTEIVFEPQGLIAGEHRVRVGTAGSATLVVQTVLPPLLLADGSSTIVVEGGTHNPMAPPYEFLAEVYLPALERLGHRFDVALERCGFAPEGGGRLQVTIHPATAVTPLVWRERGRIESRLARALVANLPLHIADRELQVVGKHLGWTERERETVVVEADGPGNVLLLRATAANAQEIVTVFGRIGRRAEEVGKRGARAMQTWLKAGVPVGAHLADQLLLPLALGKGGSFRTVQLTSHAETQVALIPLFLDVAIETVTAADGRVTLEVDTA